MAITCWKNGADIACLAGDQTLNVAVLAEPAGSTPASFADHPPGLSAKAQFTANGSVARRRIAAPVLRTASSNGRAERATGERPQRGPAPAAKHQETIRTRQGRRGHTYLGCRYWFDASNAAERTTSRAGGPRSPSRRHILTVELKESSPCKPTLFVAPTSRPARPSSMPHSRGCAPSKKSPTRSTRGGSVPTQCAKPMAASASLAYSSPTARRRLRGTPSSSRRRRTRSSRSPPRCSYAPSHPRWCT